MTEIEARRLLRQRSKGWCERCGAGGRLDYAHRRRRNVKDGHEWCTCNALHLCRTCHRWCHDNPARAIGFGLMVSSYLIPKDTSVHLLNGWWMLDCEGGGTRLPDSVGASR